MRLIGVLVIIAYMFASTVVPAGAQLLTVTVNAPIENAAFSPDGTRLAVFATDTLSIIDTASGTTRHIGVQLESEWESPHEIVWSESRIALRGRIPPDRGTYLHIIDLQTETVIWSNTYAWITGIAFHPDGNRLVLTLALDGACGWFCSTEMLMLNLETNTERVIDHTSAVESSYHFPVWSPDGQSIAVKIMSHVEVWNVETNERTASFEVQHNRHDFYTLSWDDAIYTLGENARGWTADGTSIFSVPNAFLRVNPSNPVHTAFISQTNDELLIIENGGGAVYDLQTGQMRSRLQLPFAVEWIVWQRDGLLAANIHGSTVTIGAVERQPVEINYEALRIGFVPFSEGRIVVTYYDSAINRSFMELDSNTIDGHTGQITTSAISTDERLTATGSDDTTIRLWDADTGELLHTLWGHTGTIRDIAFSPDGSRLASVADNRMMWWDTATGTLLAVAFPTTDYDRIENELRQVEYSPDGRYVVYQYWRALYLPDETQTIIWDTEQQGNIYWTSGARRLRFSPDGSRLAILTNRYQLVLLNMETLTEVPRVAADCSGFFSEFVLPYLSIPTWMAFNEDGTMMAYIETSSCAPIPVTDVSSLQPFTIWIIDPQTGELITFLKGYPSPPSGFGFLPRQMFTVRYPAGELYWDTTTWERINE